jgi:ribonucleotide reductase alpha subunit
MSLPFPGFTATPVSSASSMTSDLSPHDFKYNNGKILKELDKLKNPNNASKVIRGFDGKNYTVEDYMKTLQNQAFQVSKIGPKVEATPGIELEDIPQSEESKQTFLEQEMASLQSSILDAENNVELIDTYILGLLTGKDFTEFKMANGNKFVKVAKDEKLEKFRKQEVLDPVEEYYNDIFDDTPGSPNYGTDMTHTPEDLDQPKKTSRFNIIK